MQQKMEAGWQQNAVRFACYGGRGFDASRSAPGPPTRRFATGSKWAGWMWPSKWWRAPVAWMRENCARSRRVPKLLHGSRCARGPSRRLECRSVRLPCSRTRSVIAPCFRAWCEWHRRSAQSKRAGGSSWRSRAASARKNCTANRRGVFTNLCEAHDALCRYYGRIVHSREPGSHPAPQRNQTDNRSLDADQRTRPQFDGRDFSAV